MDDRPLADDIITDLDTPSARLGQQADAILARSAPKPLRHAVRQDADELAAWSRKRAARYAEKIRSEPVRSAAIALGVGVLIGLLLRR